MRAQAFEAFADRNQEALLALMHEDVEFLPMTAHLTTGGAPYVGHAGIARYLEDVGSSDELRVHPSEFRDLGDSVVALGGSGPAAAG